MALSLAETNSVKINGKFDYCLDSINKNPIDIENVCEIVSYRNVNQQDMNKINTEIYSLGHVQNRNGTATIVLDVYRKESLSIEGVGYECEVRVEHWKYGLSLFGYKWQSVTEEVKQLKPRECAHMKQTKECNDKPMKCADDICEYKQENKDDYSYFYTIKRDVTSCYMKKRTITASNKQAHLFGTNCMVTDYYCQLVNSIIIWDHGIIKTCPFRRLLKGVAFNIEHSTLYSPKHNLAFRMRHIKSYCNTTMIKTFEGAYVTHGNNEKFYLKTDLPADISGSHIKNIETLNMASADYRTYIANAESLKLIKSECESFKAILHATANINDRYTRFNDYKKQPIIVYSLYGELYKPDCLKVDTIYLKTRTEKCYLDFEITVTINNKNFSAFLTHYGIVKTHSQQINCIKNSIRKMKLPYSDLLIINKNNLSSVVSAKDFKLERLTFLNFRIDESINHDDVLKESTYNILKEYSNNKINDFIFTKKNTFDGSEEPAFSFIKFLLISGACVLSILFLILLICCGNRLKCCLRVHKCFSQKTESYQDVSEGMFNIEELIQMQNNRPNNQNNRQNQKRN